MEISTYFNYGSSSSHSKFQPSELYLSLVLSVAKVLPPLTFSNLHNSGTKRNTAKEHEMNLIYTWTDIFALSNRYNALSYLFAFSSKIGLKQMRGTFDNTVHTSEPPALCFINDTFTASRCGFATD